MQNEFEKIIDDFVSILFSKLFINEMKTITNSSGILNLHQINTEITCKVEKGYENKILVIFDHKEYNIQYKRIWPNWNTNDSNLRLKGNISYQYTGNLELFKENYIFIFFSV